METRGRRRRRRHELQRGCGDILSFMRSSYGKRSSACRRNSFTMEQQTGASMVTLQASHRLHPPPPLSPSPSARHRTIGACTGRAIPPTTTYNAGMRLRGAFSRSTT